MRRLSVLILALLAVFNGAVWAAIGGLSIPPKGLGWLNVIVGLVVIVIEVVLWRRYGPNDAI